MKALKKLLTPVLILMMVMASLAFTPKQAKAEDWYLIVGGQCYDSEQAFSEGLSGENWSWEGECFELSLYDGYNGGRVYCSDSITIWTYGNVTIESNEDVPLKGKHKLSIYNEGHLTIKGTNQTNVVEAGGDIDFRLCDGAVTDIKGTMSSAKDLSLVRTNNYTVSVGGQGQLNLTGTSTGGKWVNGIYAKEFKTGSWPDSNVSVNINVTGNANSTYGGASVVGLFIATGNIYLVQVDSLKITAKNTVGKNGYGIQQYSDNASMYVTGTGLHHIEGSTCAISCQDSHSIEKESTYKQIGTQKDKEIYLVRKNHYIELATEKSKYLSLAEGSATTVTWSSTDKAVAPVSSKGKVLAKTYGKTIVRAKQKSAPYNFEEWLVQTRYYDVTDSSKYWFTPVYWAADNNITKGYDNVYFGPEESCTRGQVMVFLWRLMGKPDVTDMITNPFKDVKESELGSTYYKAILWGYYAGITKGYTISGKQYFKPNETVIRKDIMIMLYRYCGKPDWYFTTERPKSGFTFTDVVGTYTPGSDTYNAIAWGYVNKITNGYSGSSPYAGQFGCTLECLRKDIVTFLYRMDQHPYQD